MAFFEFFCSLLRGRMVPFQELVTQLREELFTQNGCKYIPVKVLPTLRQILQLFRISRQGQAPGENVLVSEV